jgi:DNA-binding transcriptional MerR regulator
MDSHLYSPAEVRKLTGATRSGIRWLIERGIVVPVMKQCHFQVRRLYSEETVTTIRRITFLRHKGLSVAASLRALPEIERLEAAGKWCAIPGIQRPGTTVHSGTEPDGKENADQLAANSQAG